MDRMLPLRLLPSLMQRAVRRAMPFAVLALLMPASLPMAFAAESDRSAQAGPPLAGAAIDAEGAMSPQAQQLADRIAVTGDHAGSAFVIVDKKRARLFVFETDARLRAQSAVLLGLALGDASVPGIGTRPMGLILPAERTTPAGRFVAELGRNARGEDVVWVDYDAAVSMHRVRTGNPVERRAERLASPTIDDNRISYGCINVPVAFYENYIRPIFERRKAMVYVMPDMKSDNEVFGSTQVSVTQSTAHSAVSDPMHGGTEVLQSLPSH